MGWFARSAGSVRRTSTLLAGAITTMAALVGCSNTPPPPIVTSPPSVSTPTRAPAPTEIVVGVDTLSGGLNPHRLADHNRTSALLAELMLPSVFRPAPDGSLQLDRTLAVSAEVTRTEPYTVTYVLRQDASWSDSAPIAAEDFVYLWERMRSEPGVINPAGYRLIETVNSRDGGKTVEVVFREPYPAWRTLFNDLLPAHLLKDAPGGWANAMDDAYPASGGPFAVKQLDRARGEIVLERNDRYWAKPAVVDQIVLRSGENAALVSALRSGDTQLALLQADSIAMGMLRELVTEASQPPTSSVTTPVEPTATGAGGPTTSGEPAAQAGTTPADGSRPAPVEITTVPRGTVVQLLLRPESPRMADQRVRAAVVAALDRAALVAAGTGGGPSVEYVADAHVLAPSRPGYRSTAPQSGPPAQPDPALTEQLLTEAGYTRTAAGWMRDGQPLSLVVAAPAGQEPYQELAQLVRQQLIAAGIAVTLVTPTPDELFDELLAGSSVGSPGTAAVSVDLAVVPMPVAGDPATVLASQYGCPPEGDDPAEPGRPNLAGFCAPTLQPTIDAALTGRMLLEEALAVVEPALWQQAVAVPLFQLTDVLVTRSEVQGVTAGAPFTGPFGGAAEWRKVQR